MRLLIRVLYKTEKLPKSQDMSRTTVKKSGYRINLFFNSSKVTLYWKVRDSRPFNVYINIFVKMFLKISLFLNTFPYLMQIVFKQIYFCKFHPLLIPFGVKYSITMMMEKGSSKKFFCLTQHVWSVLITYMI